MREYDVEMTWEHRGRYLITERYHKKASNIRAAVGKALSEKRKGWREQSGRTLLIKVIVVGGKP